MRLWWLKKLLVFQKKMSLYHRLDNMVKENAPVLSLITAIVTLVGLLATVLNIGVWKGGLDKDLTVVTQKTIDNSNRITLMQTAQDVNHDLLIEVARDLSNLIRALEKKGY